jgi:Flp pilus assembly protein protease CpaA
MALALALALAAGEDLRTREIPNALSLVVGMGALALYPGDWASGLWAMGFMGVVALGGRTIGMGDVKLSYGLGVLMGPHWLMGLGLAFASSLVLWRRGTYPFGPFLIGAAIIIWRFVR